jgi:hypothetical protein
VVLPTILVRQEGPLAAVAALGPVVRQSEAITWGSLPMPLRRRKPNAPNGLRASWGARSMLMKRPRSSRLGHIMGQPLCNHPWKSCHIDAGFSTQVNQSLAYFARAIK